MPINFSITDPAFLFPGISLLFLAYTNRYLALASIVRKLNDHDANDVNENRNKQIESLHLRILLIKYMQVFGVLAFLCCIVTMLVLIFDLQKVALVLFTASLGFMTVSLLLSLTEIMQSGKSLRIELDRTGTKGAKRPKRLS